MNDRIYSAQFHAAPGVEAWRVLPEGAYAFFRTDSFEVATRFVVAIAAIVGDGEPPNVDIRRHGVTVLIGAFKGAEYGLIERDLALARAIAARAAEMGLEADPSVIQSILLIPGALDRTTIMPFWQAVLGYVPRADSPDEDMVDPHDRLPPFWFEEMEQLRADGIGMIHPCVWVPWDQAQARVDAALAAGGRLVRRVEEEAYWVLADPAGNEVDIATTSSPEGTDAS